MRLSSLTASGLSALLVALTATGVSAAPIDLSHWKLTIPESAGFSDKPKELDPDALRGYSSEWFHAAADGGIVFRAPVGGAHTAHSHYARSELREQLVPGNNKVNWTSSDHAELNATLKVNEVPPATGRVIIGQIHGKDAVPLLKITYERNAENPGGVLYGKFVVAPKAEGDEASETNEKCVLRTGIPLGETFSYRIEVADGTLSFSAGGGQTCSRSLAAWRGVPLYFKAGVYTLASDGGGAGETEFYQLDVRH